MEKDNKILDQIFSYLLNLEGVKKRPELNLMNISFGFSSDLSNYPYLFLYSLNDKREDVIVSKTKISDLMKQNYSEESGYSQLPIFFETDIFGKNWNIRICGDYYLCNNIATLTWGSFCVTKSKEVAISWIKDKKEKQEEGLKKYENDLKEADTKAKILRDYEIPKFKKVLEDFELAQTKFNL